MRKLIACVVLVFSTTALAAQVPATVHATWTPNPPTDNVTQYQITVDTAAPITILSSACSPTTCGPIALTVPTFGSHNVSLVAQNLFISSDPTSALQSSPPTIVSFTLGAAPVIVAGLKIGK